MMTIKVILVKGNVTAAVNVNDESNLNQHFKAGYKYKGLTASIWIN